MFRNPFSLLFRLLPGGGCLGPIIFLMVLSYFFPGVLGILLAGAKTIGMALIASLAP